VRKTFLCGLVVVALTLAFGASTAMANHSWGNYHWARTANPFTVKVGNNMTGTWPSKLSTASADWTSSTVLDAPVVTGAARGRCRPTNGRVEVCNDTYGFNGWLGLAQIWISSNHITQGAAKMNDSYLNSPSYSDVNKQHVICQEVGHTFGLGHQDESGADLNTCMDYAASLDNPSPNAHDYEQLETIYNSHTDSTNTSFGPTPEGSGAGVVWLTPSHAVEHLGGGFEIHTFIIWAR
jgi:hypothetical protein